MKVTGTDILMLNENDELVVVSVNNEERESGDTVYSIRVGNEFWCTCETVEQVEIEVEEIKDAYSLVPFTI